MATVTIRKLLRKDRRVLAMLIKKLIEKIGATDLLTMISADASPAPAKVGTAAPAAAYDARMIGVGLNILRTMLDVLEEDITAWFADLVGVPAEEFDSLPFDVEIEIMDQLVKCPEAGDFFTGASRLYSSMRGFAGQLKKAKAK